MWKLDGRTATFESERFAIEMRIDQPASGISPVRFNSHELPIRALQLSGYPRSTGKAEPIEEAYVRGDDLIVNYDLTAERTAAPDIVWTARATANTLQVEVTIAMTTPWLESDPRIQLKTKFESLADGFVACGRSADDLTFRSLSETQTDMQGVFLFPLGHNVTYVEMVHPSDFDASQFRNDDDGMEYWLIREHLEKGVIRKARVQAIWTADDDARQTAIEAFQALREAAPPLTT